MHSRLAWLLLVAGCGRIGFEPDPADLDPADQTDLVVSITDDRLTSTTLASPADLPAGTGGLSLREALVIAANRPGPDLVAFDRAVFSIATPPTITVNSELVIGTDTTLAAFARGVVITSAAGYAGALLRVAGNGVVDGLAFRGGTPAIVADGATGFAIRHVTIAGASGDGIRITNGRSGVIEDSRIEQPVGTPVGLVDSTDVVLRRTFVALNAKVGPVRGVEVLRGLRIQLHDNIIDPGEAFLVSVESSADTELIGNVFDGGDTGLAILGTSTRTLVLRNVCVNPLYDSIYIASGVTDTTIVHTTFFLAGSPVDSGTNTTVQNSLLSSAAGDFVDAATYDFHLVANSPAIDAASDLGLDLLPGLPARYLGAAPDLGAIESY